MINWEIKYRQHKKLDNNINYVVVILHFNFYRIQIPFIKQQSAKDALKNIQKQQQHALSEEQKKSRISKFSRNNKQSLNRNQQKQQQEISQQQPEKPSKSQIKKIKSPAIEQQQPLSNSQDKNNNHVKSDEKIKECESKSQVTQRLQINVENQDIRQSVLYLPLQQKDDISQYDPTKPIEKKIDDKTQEFLNNQPKRPPLKQNTIENNKIQQLKSSQQLGEYSNSESLNKFQVQKVQEWQKLNKQIRLEDIQLEGQSKQMVDDFTESQMKQTIEDMISNKVNYNVRRLQSALFVSHINSNINDVHKQGLRTDPNNQLTHYLWLGLWCFLLACGITLLIVYSKIKTLLNIMSYPFYFFISLEYTLMFAAIKIAQYADKPKVPDQQQEREYVKENKVALIIPVGWGVKGLTEAQRNQKRDAKLEVLNNTLKAASKVFRNTDIYIFHNSSDQQLPDKVVMDACMDKAIYVPLGLGSKSVSCYYGAILAEWLNYEFALVMDDDTQLPETMVQALNQDLQDDAYCFAIAAASNDEWNNVPKSAKVLIGLQDIEYKLSDLAKLLQNKWTSTSSVLSPHGAINMWRINSKKYGNVLKQIMAKHNFIFSGEDYQQGLIMRQAFPESKLTIISSCIIDTVAPATLKDLFMQRFTSWDVAAHQFLFGGMCSSSSSAFFMQVLFCLPCTIDNAFLRITTLEDVWTVLQDYLRVILLAYHILMSIIYRYFNVVIFIMYIVTIGSQWVISFALEKYKFKQRPDLQVKQDVRLLCVCLFPIYRFCFGFVRVLALLRYFFKYEAIQRDALPGKDRNLPYPQEIQFAYPGLNRQSSLQNQNQKLDYNMIQNIVEITLNRKKQYKRETGEFSQSIQQYGRSSLQDRAVMQRSRASLLPKQDIPQRMSIYEHSISSLSTSQISNVKSIPK